MCPEFFSIGWFTLRAWGVMLTVSFFIGLWLAKFEARTLRLNYDRLFNLGFIICISGVIGARLAYVIFHLPEFTDDPLDIINPFAVEGQFGIAGMTLHGGVILAVLASAWYMRRHQMSFFEYADAVMVPLAFGLFLSRLGCFLNGCCYGAPTESFLGIEFPLDTPAGATFPYAHVHPTQLYSSVFGLVLFFGLRALNRQRGFPGQTTAVFFILMGAFRFGIDFIRYYEPAMMLGVNHLTYNHLTALGILAFGVAVYVVQHRKKARVQSTDAPVKTA